VTLTVDSTALKRSEVASALRNTQKHTHAVVGVQKSFDELKVAAFRNFCIDFFDEANAPKDSLELARHGADKLKGKLDELKATVTGSQYPFVGQLSAPIGLLEQVSGKPDEWFLNNFQLGDDLLDAKESVIDPIQAFLNGAQRMIYDDAAALLTANGSNLGYLPAGSDSAVTDALADPNAFRGNRMAQLKKAADALWSRVDTVVATNRTEVTGSIEGRKTELLASDYYVKASPAAQESVARTVDSLIGRVGTESQVAVIRELGSSFEATTYPSLLDQLAAYPEDGGGEDAPAPKQTVSVKTVTVAGANGVLETEHDVDRYLAMLRTALLNTLNDGKRVSL